MHHFIFLTPLYLVDFNSFYFGVVNFVMSYVSFRSSFRSRDLYVDSVVGFCWLIIVYLVCAMSFGIDLSCVALCLPHV